MPWRCRVGSALACRVVLAAALVLTYVEAAAARARGIVVSSCDGCHGGIGNASPDLALSAMPEAFNPGDPVTLTLTIRSPSVQVGGAFITTDGVGALRALAGEGLAQGAQGLTHSAPKAAANGAVTFRFAWQAPATPGAVDFRVLAVAANGNNASSGDAPGSASFSWAFGCPARELYLDLDRDGYGSKALGHRLGCTGDAAPAGYAPLTGDCDENDETVRPGAAEVCNGRDDDCDAQIDEDAAPVPMWPDADGDGYYAQQTGDSKLGCGNLPGYAPNPGDCNDTDRAIHPGAAETCNERDDDCDQQVDELVRPQCGLGWCARYSATCDPDDCQAGPPAVEKCNHFDDDCDGEDDNGACADGSPPSAPISSAGSATQPAASADQTTAARSPSGCNSTPLQQSRGAWSLVIMACVGIGGWRRVRRAKAHDCDARLN